MTQSELLKAGERLSEKPWEFLEKKFERIYKKPPTEGIKSQLFIMWVRHLYRLDPLPFVLNQNRRVRGQAKLAQEGKE